MVSHRAVTLSWSCVSWSSRMALSTLFAEEVHPSEKGDTNGTWEAKLGPESSGKLSQWLDSCKFTELKLVLLRGIFRHIHLHMESTGSYILKMEAQNIKLFPADWQMHLLQGKWGLSELCGKDSQIAESQFSHTQFYLTSLRLLQSLSDNYYVHIIIREKQI